MPGLTGLEAARRIVQLPWPDDASLPEIVFVTAYDERALQAFEQGAVDYVLKPAQAERLRTTAERLQRRLAERGTPAEAPPPLQQLLHRLAARLEPGRAAPPLKWIQAGVGPEIRMIAVDAVLYFISDDKYTRVQTADMEALIRKPIKELVEALDPERSPADPPLGAGQCAGDRRRGPRRSRPADRQRQGPARKARSQPQLRRAVQGDVSARSRGNHDAMHHCASQ